MDSEIKMNPGEIPSVIVMKGLPFTGKTKLAHMIATYFNCPMLSLEYLLDDLTPPLSPEQEFEAFKVICRIAYQQIDSKIFKNVVVDSPLSSELHFIHLKRCLGYANGRVIVIECKPTNTYSWKLKVGQHLAYRPAYVKWYKPKSLEDVEKAIQEHQDYDVTSVSSIYRCRFVSKLVLDPFLDCPFEGSYPMYSGTHPFIEAVKYMMTHDPRDGPAVIIYRQWLQQQSKHLPSSSSSSSLGETHCSTHGHDIVPNSTAVPVEGIQDETVACMACQSQIMRTNNAYCYCTNCSLTLHMECAQSSRYNFVGRKRGVLHFGKPFSGCKPCTEAGKGYSIKCKTCEFEYHLRTLRSPIAIKHFDTKEHFLTVLFSNNEEVYRCFACGQNREKNMYLCKDCGVTYHYECIKLPSRVKNVHGGYHHYLSLKFQSEEADDYICQECHDYRDPALWYYSCEDCSGYELHPSCVAKLRAWYGFEVYREWMEIEEIKASKMFDYAALKMKESESISDFYSRVIYLIQWYGDSTEEAGVFDRILGSLPLKFYHLVVAIKRSEEYETMTVDQLMIYLRIYEKKIENGEDVLIEQVLANLFATHQSSYWRKNKKWITNVKDVSLESVLLTDYSKQESGDNWVKHWGKYWDRYWFIYHRGYYGKGTHRRQYKSQVQCSICKMFGHYPRHCWIVPNNVKRKPLKIKFLIQTHSSQRRSIIKSPATISPKD